MTAVQMLHRAGDGNGEGSGPRSRLAASGRGRVVWGRELVFLGMLGLGAAGREHKAPEQAGKDEKRRQQPQAVQVTL